MVMTHVVKAYAVSKGRTVVVSIPKQIRKSMNIKEGTWFSVRSDGKDKLVYEVMP